MGLGIGNQFMYLLVLGDVSSLFNEYHRVITNVILSLETVDAVTVI